MSASTQKMPRLTARDTPRFDGNKSENISITDDAEKKKHLVRYTDADTEEEWKSLDEYGAGTFARFKEAIIKNYPHWIKANQNYSKETLYIFIIFMMPEAQDTESGTVNRLTHITRSFKNLGLDKREEYLKFKRKFLTEPRKLQKPPLIITNQELVTKFLEALSPTFRENVSARLSIKHGLKSSLTPAAAAPVAASATAATATAPTPAKAVVRWEDLHTLAEVVAEADDIALNMSGIYGVTEASPLEISSSSRKDSSGLKVEVKEVKQQVISLLDHLDISEKQSDARQKQLLEAFQQAKNTGPEQSNSRNNESRSASANDVCWYDRKLRHFAKDCEQTKKHIAEGLLKIVNDKIVMSDGSPVPSQLAQKALFE
ncbi:hypothetical protein EDD85DRAFT_798157 [Armillaria nabsnona]|nr:hypothetical protein EDD85DRAFT_798157 [Armillaria nabsnona]